MISRFKNIIEAGAYSGLNFLITLYLTKLGRTDLIEVYAVSLTCSLVALSFLRQIYFVPYGIHQKDRVTISWVLLRLILIFVFVSVAFFLYSGNANLSFVFFSVFFFNIFYEAIRYIAPNKCLPAIAVLYLLLGLCFVVFGSIDIAILASFFLVALALVFSLSYRRREEDRFFYSLNFGFLSVAQIFLIHAPFLYIGFLSNAGVVAYLFVCRSMFQGGQIYLRSKEISIIHSVRNEQRYNGLSKLLVGTLGCSIVTATIFGFTHPDSVLEMLPACIAWLCIILILSIIRVQEFVNYMKFGDNYINTRAYFLGAIFVFLMLVLSPPAWREVNGVSIVLCGGWLMTLTLLYVSKRQKFFL